MTNIKMRKVTCTFYTDCENIEDALREELLCSSRITADGLLNIAEKEVNVNFSLKDGYIVMSNNNYMNVNTIFNLDVMSDDILRIPEKQKEFKRDNGLYNDCNIHEYMPYRYVSQYSYINGGREKVMRKSYDTPLSVYNLERDKEELEKKRFTEGTDVYRLYTRVCNGNLVGTIKPVEPSFYLKFIDSQTSNILVKFLNKKLGTEEQYNNQEFIDNIVSKFEKSIKKLVKDKNVSVLTTILKILVTNNVNEYKREYIDKYKDGRYNVSVDPYKYTLPKDTYLKLIGIIKPALNIRNLSAFLNELLSKSYLLTESLSDINYNSEYINKPSVAMIIARDILTGTSILPEEYEEFLFEQEHKTSYEKVKARAIRIILECFNQRGVYNNTLANSSWNIEMCRCSIRQINALLLSSKRDHTKIEHRDYSFNYDTYEYEINKDLLLINDLNEEEMKDVMNILGFLFKLFFINKELPEEIRGLEFSLFKASSNFPIVETIKTNLLDVLENCEGRETSTVKSMIRNEIYINGVNIFDKLDNKYSKIRELKMRTILQK